MPFNQKPQKFNAKINAVTVGTGDKAVVIGGNYVGCTTIAEIAKKSAAI